MAARLTYLLTALQQQQKPALSSSSAPSPAEACDSRHFSWSERASRADRGPDLLDTFAQPTPQEQ